MKGRSIKMKLATVIALVSALLLGACTENKFEDAQKEHLVNSMIMSQVIAAGTPTCTPTGTSPSFSTLAADFKASCNSCHTGATARNNFDVNVYSSVLARVTKGNPSQSLLYQKISPGGTMSNISNNPAFPQLVYDWILGCAAP